MGGRKMKAFKRGCLGHLKLIGVVVAIFAFASCAAAAPYDQILQRWTKTNQYKNDIGAEMWISASYYAAEYIEALVQAEADKNLWTEDELERYKYELLKALQLEEYLPFRIEFDNRASPISMAPFDEQVTLWIGNKKYKPMDYDKRFNFKLSGKRDGMVYFPRYDEKGKSLLDGVKTVKLEINGNISPVTIGRSIEFMWDVGQDDPERLFRGRAAAQLELDRLIRRLEQLNKQRTELERQLQELTEEINRVQTRVDDLQRQ